MSTRIRRPRKAKDNELKASWGKLPHSKPDICYAWGDQCSGRDGSILHYYFSSGHYRPGQAWDEKPEPSMIEELEARGYDITTLKFSIQKRV